MPHHPDRPPRRLTTFVGRERELRDALRLIHRSRLLTLTGPGGVGKTRLAFEVAERLPNEDADEVVATELAGLREPSLVPLAVGSTLGIGEESSRPILATLLERLSDRRLCLVLDGCDHLLGECVSLVEMLLRSCPDLRILATSRAIFGIAGETVYGVAPLSQPDPGHASTPAGYLRSEAVRLFVERAQRRLPDFDLTEANAVVIAQICRRLDGIPLAIELAAARVPVLSPEQILSRLNDRFRLLTTGDPTAHPRQRSLEATLDWSYDLLPEAEQVLFRRLAVFPGSFTLEAVEAICPGEGLRQEEVLDLLSRLVDQSLVLCRTNGGARSTMLETLRAYAQARLQRSGELEALRERHRAWFMDFPYASGMGDRTAWLDGLEEELENLRAAFAWSLDQGDVQGAHRLAVSLTPLWCARGFLTEGRQWFERVQARSGELPGEMNAESLLHLGLDVAKQGEDGLARALLEQSLDLFRDLRNTSGTARAANALGITALGRGDLARASRHFEECLNIARRTGDHARAASTLNNLGLVAFKAGQADRALSLLEEGLGLARTHGNTPAIAAALANLGGVASRRREHARARVHLEESLTLFLADGARAGVAECLEGLATVAAAQGHTARTARLLGSADGLRESMHLPREPNDSAFSGALGAIRGQCTRAPLAEEYRAGRAMPLEDAVAYARGEPRLKAAPALRIRSLGPVEVLRGGHPLGRSDWTYSKARELLLFLLNHSSRSKEQVGVALWPDISPTQLRGTFRVTLYHLRRTLGQPDWILYTGDGYAFNRSLEYWYDVEAFEGALGEAARLKSREPAEAMEKLQMAIDLYRGPFLEDLSDGQWYLLRREQLGREFLEALLSLGGLAFDHGLYERAIESYGRVIQLDGYLEVAHRQLMRCYQALGERAQALRHYEVLVSRFRDELGIAPDEETAALAARLRGGKGI